MADKPRRRSRAELRNLMLNAGQEVLFKLEPTLGFERLTYSAVFDHLQTNYGQRVTIGSVHERIWKSQRDFQLDVVAEALLGSLPDAPDDALDNAAAAIAMSDLSTPAARRRTLQTAVRLSSSHYNPSVYSEAITLAHTIRFRLWELGPDHPEAEGFTDAIKSIRTASAQGYSAHVRAMMEHIGLRVRPEAGDPDEVIETIVLLGNAIDVGLRTDPLDVARRPRQIPTGPNSEREEWFPDAIALWAFVQSVLELDGDTLTDDERRL